MARFQDRQVGQARAGRAAGISKVREAVLEACERMNRPVEEAAKALEYLEREWLCDPWTLGTMSEEAWKELRLPLGLKEFLRLRFRGLGPGGLGGPSGGPGPVGPVIPMSPVSQVFQDRPPQVAAETSAVQALLSRIQEKMTKEKRTLKGLQRRFKRMDDDLDNYMDFEEFVNAMKELHPSLSDSELQTLWRYVDRDGNGRVTFEQFLKIFKPKLSGRRRELVNAVFDHLDANRNGVIQVDDLKLRCDPSALAEGLHKAHGRKVQPDQGLLNFLENFRKLVGGNVYGEVRYDDFASYYESLSAGIDTDAYFEEVLRKVWDLPSGFFQHLEGADAGHGGSVPRSVVPHHQHHNPTFLDHVQGEKRRSGQARTGHRLLRTLRRCLAQCCRGNAAMLYGDLVVRTYNPCPRRGEVAPPELVEKKTFEAAALRLLPSLPPTDLSTLTAIFQDAVRAECVNYKSFLQCLQETSASRQDCALRVFEDLAGTSSGSLDLHDGLLSVPPGVASIFGDRPISAQSWLNFHDLVAMAAGETSDAVYEAQLRYLWGLRNASHQGDALAPVPGYYRGISRVHLG